MGLSHAHEIPFDFATPGVAGAYLALAFLSPATRASSRNQAVAEWTVLGAGSAIRTPLPLMGPVLGLRCTLGVGKVLASLIEDTACRRSTWKRERIRIARRAFDP